MKFLVVASAMAAVVSASMQVHLYSDDQCKTEIPVQRNQLMAPSDCVVVQSPIDVPEMNQKYTYLRQSHIADEILLFEDYKTCIAYPSTFDKNEQVTFIRSPSDNECTPCPRCGTVSSVKMVSQADISASNMVTPAVVALVLAGASTLFL